MFETAHEQKSCYELKGLIMVAVLVGFPILSTTGWVGEGRFSPQPFSVYLRPSERQLRSLGASSLHAVSYSVLAWA